MTTDGDRLRAIMARLRDPESGCSWDRAQTPTSLLPYTLEEVYELVEAVDNGHPEDICDELGDLLFHIVFYAWIAEEAGHFTYSEVIDGVCEKLVRRHPHVFSSRQYASTAEQRQDWLRIKAQERRQNGRQESVTDGSLAEVSRALPALLRARKLLQRAALAGFDWRNETEALAKVTEELREVGEELQQGKSQQHLEAEIGDLLLATSNLARHCGIDAEAALRGANNRFVKRFSYVEKCLLDEQTTVAETSSEKLLWLWQQAKDEDAV